MARFVVYFTTITKKKSLNPLTKGTLVKTQGTNLRCPWDSAKDSRGLRPQTPPQLHTKVDQGHLAQDLG
jgi:hypothetical protein